VIDVNDKSDTDEFLGKRKLCINDDEEGNESKRKKPNNGDEEDESQYEIGTPESL
jgi:hypothetical protein